MLKALPFFLALIMLTINFAFADNFVVTSNADAGPGTLRQALIDAAANGSDVKDNILFNISDQSEAGRTINLQSQLPELSSNLVIDGTTQPGNKFGVSDAKVELLYNIPTEVLSGLKAVGKSNIELYGLYLKNITPITSANTFFLLHGIYLENDNNIKIGAAGKGNVIVGFFDALTSNSETLSSQDFSKLVTNLTVQHSFLGIDADGESLSANLTSTNYLYALAGNILIGGSTAESNLIAQGLYIYQFNTKTNSSVPDADISIKNNNFGVDYQSNVAIPGSAGISIVTSNAYGRSAVTIEDNVISGSFQGHALYISNIDKKVNIFRNYIGTDRTRQKSFATDGIILNWITGQAAIGSANSTDANYITNCNPIIVRPSSNATINKNSLYCAKNVTAVHAGMAQGYEFPFVYITSITANSLKGTATPKSTIELFYSDHCDTWQPETFFTTVQTDDNGNWTYNGPLNGYIVASATLDKNTSDFSTTGVDVKNIKIVSACTGLGSITGAIPHSYTSMKWENESGDVVGTSPDLLNVPIGKYKLVVQYGNNSVSTGYFKIDQFVPQSFTVMLILRLLSPILA